MNKHTYVAPCDQETLRRMYITDGMTFREVSAALGCSIKCIQTMMRRYKIRARVAAKREQRGANNSSWKADGAGYQALHLRVAERRGKPSRCEHCGTRKAKRYEWANMSDRFADVMDYKRLCSSCHKIHDNARARSGK